MVPSHLRARIAADPVRSSTDASLGTSPFRETDSRNAGPVILATDTYYGPTRTRTAGVLFREWSDAEPHSTHVVELTGDVADYEPGAFYLRELPLILTLLDDVETPSTIVIDGYVYLDQEGRKGLGAHLFEALGERIPVIGVAKRPFAGSPHSIEVRRGTSERALFVTAAGVPLERAAEWIRSMSGSYRQPTLLKAVDRLSRQG